jgi:excisionase family DNA binding protein
VSTSEVARFTGWSKRTIQKYARLGIIPGAFQPQGKRYGWRFKRKALEEWWANQGH